MAYKLLPGVMQDHKGRTFQYAVYPSGKVIHVPCTSALDVPKHQPIPVREPKPRRLLTLRGDPTTGLERRSFRPHQAKRVPTVDLRWKESAHISRSAFATSADMHDWVDVHKQEMDHHYMYIKEIT